MIKKLLLTVAFFISIAGYGQIDYSVIDQKSEKVPDSIEIYSVIANYLTNGLKSDKEKARAIYIWISHNIKYDLSQINSNKRYASQEEIVAEVLNTRVGICQHYSELFLAMCNSVELNCYLIPGYTRNVFGKVDKYSHAWNGLMIDTNYYMVDVTWASGHLDNERYVHIFNDKYFLIPPSKFIKTHMPFDPLWQFIDNPINNNDFISQDFSKLDSAGAFSFADSIDQYQQLDKINQLENTNRRIISCGVENSLIQKQVEENYMQLTNANYNRAIDTLNSGIDYYNQYITNKNRQFRSPKLEDSDIVNLIENAENGVYTANEIIYSLISTDEDLKILIADARDQLPGLISDLEREKEFVDKYIKRWRPFRVFMFLTFE